MYFKFAWRYFRAKKSANAINIIAWVTTCVVAFACCCQILVLSVYNGFEDLVKSLYSSFYTDIKIEPANGKTFMLSQEKLNQLKKEPYIGTISMVAEEKAILQNGELRTGLNLKGVDANYYKVSGVPEKLIGGDFDLGSGAEPGLVVGAGVQNAAEISVDPIFASDQLNVTLPKKNVDSNDPMASISEGQLKATGVFAIQQEFDNNYGLTNIDFIKEHMNFLPDEYSAAEIKLGPDVYISKAKASLQKILGTDYLVKSKYEQNSNLYNTIRLEKWAIYAVLTLILIIAAFNMVSALTMLVLEKQKDISILQSMGATRGMIQKIFLAEGFLLGLFGAVTGIVLATIICLLQLKFKLIKMQGGSFLIDYFPVKMLASDYILVGSTAVLITFFASWFPAFKASRQLRGLK